MGFLRKIDIFKSVNSEHKQGSILGSILTIFCVVFIFVFTFKEMKVYKHQKLISKLYVSDAEDKFVKVYVDVSFYKISCDVIQFSVSKYEEK